MEIKVGRFKTRNKVTIGEVWINGKFVCYSLEDEIRPILAKVWGETAIPAGKYNLIMSFSNRFQQYMPEIQNVKGFSGVRIHTGNVIEHTHGCLLVGYKTDGTKIWESKEAYAEVYHKIKEVETKEKITIEYINTNKEWAK